MVVEELSSDSEDDDPAAEPPKGAVEGDLSQPAKEVRPVLVTLTSAKEVKEREAEPAAPTMSSVSRLDLPDDVYALRTRINGVLAQIRSLHWSMQDYVAAPESEGVELLEVHARIQETLAQQCKVLEGALAKHGAGIGLVQIEDLHRVLETYGAGPDRMKPG